MKGVRFRIFEPMMFRAPSEFTPEAKGITLARSLPVPHPSTLAGAIGSVLYEEGARPSGETWYEELESILGLTSNCMLRGPYIVANNKVYVQYFNDLIDLNFLYHDVVNVLKEIVTGDAKTLSENLKKLEELFNENKVELSVQSRTGIGLDPSKITIRGLIYGADMVDYSCLGDEVFVAIDVIGDINFDKIAGKVIKLGGEGRISKIELEEPLLTNKIRENKKKGEKGYALYLISPALFKTKNELKSCKLSAKLSTFPSPFDLLKEKLKLDVSMIIGRVSVASAGFKIDREVRKPIYMVLEPGSIVFANDLAYSISEVAEKLGYGTVAPIPL